MRFSAVVLRTLATSLEGPRRVRLHSHLTGFCLVVSDLSSASLLEAIPHGGWQSHNPAWLTRFAAPCRISTRPAVTLPVKLHGR